MTTPTALPRATALIAEDEPLLAAALQADLAAVWPQLQVLATVGDGHSAVRRALELQPDVLLFDIRMPGQTGLQAAAELADAWPEQGSRAFPQLVFVTAYDQYAVAAFETQAVDYILKPVQRERPKKTVQKLASAIPHQPRHPQPLPPLTPPAPPPPPRCWPSFRPCWPRPGQTWHPRHATTQSPPGSRSYRPATPEPRAAHW